MPDPISIIIPVRNGAATLARAVESLLATGQAGLDIVIVDDGSTDATLEVAGALATAHAATVRVLPPRPAAAMPGVSAARNRGIRASTGELVGFLDADDTVLPNRFATAVPLLAGNPDCDGVYELTTVAVEDGSGRSAVWTDGGTFGLDEPVPPDALLRTLLTDRSWHVSGILVRRTLLERTGLFHEGLRIAEDCHLWFRLAAVGRLLPGEFTAPVSVYHRHAANTYQAAVERKVDMLRALADAWRWARRQRLERRVRAEFSAGVRHYLVRAIIAARDAGRRDVAWQLVRTAAMRGACTALADRRVLRQMLAMARAKSRGRRSEVGGRRSEPRA